MASLPPSALRAATSLAEGGKERRIPTPVTAGHTGPALQGAAVIQGGQGRPPLQSRTGTVRKGDVGDGVPYDFCAGRGGGRSPHLPLKFIRTAQKIYCLFCHNVT